MISQSRTRAAVLSMTALSAALALVGGLAAMPPATARAGTASDDKAHQRALTLLDQVEDLRSPAAARKADREAPRRDVTMLLRDLRHAMPELTRDERARADAALDLFIPAPRTTCANEALSWQAVQSSQGHFCVHYKAGFAAQASASAVALEEVWAYEIGKLGYRQPVSDGGGGFDVFLDDIGDDGYYGACVPNSNDAKTASSCVLDDDFSEFPPTPPNFARKVTAAHEFFHAIQFAYDSYQDAWFMEGTAVWVEDEVYPTVNDYVQYLDSSAITFPGVSINNNNYPWIYGSVIFWKYLAESLHDRSVIRSIWNAADASTGRSGIGAVRALLSARHLDFAKLFAKFGAWNTKPNGSYRDRARFPAPGWGLKKTLSAIGSDTGWLGVGLNHLTNTSALIWPGSSLPSSALLRVQVNGPSYVSPKALIHLRLRSGTVKYVYVPLNSEGNGTKTVGFNPDSVAAVVVTMTNPHSTANNRSYQVRLSVTR